jgi:50S ribosomal protein L16 3-hydroxylase
MSAGNFLERHWQKSLLFMPQALPDALPELSRDELGWLATLDDVESRLVFSESGNSATNYRVEHGPFDEKLLAALPAENWTLLVQDVEKHLPVFRHLLDEASFIPDWRIDDLMVSFAAPGGSVGPHRDNYDVFLCQGSGRREWRIAPDDADLTMIESGELSLLKPFTDHEAMEAGHGDVLYLPPGVAHWGIALEPCLTYSIGMRAPTLSEFMTGISRISGAEIEFDRAEEHFYEDPDLSPGEAEPGLISVRAIERARRSFTTAATLNDDDFAAVFGSVVTEVKAWLAPEPVSRREFENLLESGPPEIQVHGMARLAYFAGGGQDYVFANGRVRTLSAPEVEQVREICRRRQANAGRNELLFWLAAKGTFELPVEREGDTT